MDLIDKLTELAGRIQRQKDSVFTEEAAKTAFVLPFLQALGYDVFNPSEASPLASWPLTLTLFDNCRRKHATAYFAMQLVKNWVIISRYKKTRSTQRQFVEALTPIICHIKKVRL